jgi:hypothetical protein
MRATTSSMRGTLDGKAPGTSRTFVLRVMG